MSFHPSTVIGIFRTRTAQVTAAVDPYHDRLTHLTIKRSGPNVQREAIFTLPCLAQGETGACRLYRDGTKLLRGSHSLPFFEWLGSAPT